MLFIILLAKVFGDCVNPTIEECAAKSSEASCNAAGSGCRYRKANSGACGLPSADFCAAKTQSLCTGGCLWSTDAACVRTSNPICNRTFSSPYCSAGCAFDTSLESTRCLGSYQYMATSCGMLSMDPDNSQYCTKVNGCFTFTGGFCTTNIFWGCKIEGSKCVAKSEKEYYSEECQNRGVGNNGDDCRLGRCKVKDGVCVPNTLQDRAELACEAACTDPMYCKSEGTNCVVKTKTEIYEYWCSQIATASCVTFGRGGCKVVNNECVPNPNYDPDVAYSPVCSLNSEGDACDADSINSYCETVRDTCVLQACDAGGTCSAASLDAGCSTVAAGSGFCGVNSALATCVTATECSSALIQAGCANTPAVASACLPKAELACSSSDTCRPEELTAGCKTVSANTDTATTVAVPMIVFVLLALFW